MKKKASTGKEVRDIGKIKELVEKRIALLAKASKKESEKKSVSAEIKRLEAELDGVDRLLEEALEG